MVGRSPCTDVKRAYRPQYLGLIRGHGQWADSEVSAVNEFWNEWEDYSARCKNPNEHQGIQANARGTLGWWPQTYHDVKQRAKQTDKSFRAAMKRTATRLFTNPRADLKVVSRGATAIYDAAIDVAAGFQYIGDAIQLIANGECNTTKPMDKAHEFIDAGHRRIGKGMKILRGLT